MIYQLNNSYKIFSKTPSKLLNTLVLIDGLLTCAGAFTLPCTKNFPVIDIWCCHFLASSTVDIR